MWSVTFDIFFVQYRYLVVMHNAACQSTGGGRNPFPPVTHPLADTVHNTVLA
jgi:hypothetical protein